MSIVSCSTGVEPKKGILDVHIHCEETSIPDSFI